MAKDVPGTALEGGTPCRTWLRDGFTGKSVHLLPLAGCWGCNRGGRKASGRGHRAGLVLCVWTLDQNLQEDVSLAGEAVPCPEPPSFCGVSSGHWPYPVVCGVRSGELSAREAAEGLWFPEQGLRKVERAEAEAGQKARRATLEEGREALPAGGLAS